MTRNVIQTRPRLSDRGVIWLAIAAVSALWIGCIAWAVLS